MELKPKFFDPTTTFRSISIFYDFMETRPIDGINSGRQFQFKLAGIKIHVNKTNATPGTFLLFFLKNKHVFDFCNITYLYRVS